MYINDAVINYGTVIKVQADESGMTLKDEDESRSFFISTDEFGELIQLAKLLHWECVDEL